VRTLCCAEIRLLPRLVVERNFKRAFADFNICPEDWPCHGIRSSGCLYCFHFICYCWGCVQLFSIHTGLTLEELERKLSGEQARFESELQDQKSGDMGIDDAEDVEVQDAELDREIEFIARPASINFQVEGQILKIWLALKMWALSFKYHWLP
jgi:hypothetical protein